MLPEIKTILWCTALGPNAAIVFRWAYTLAKRFQSRIVALHVIETLSARQRALVEGYSGVGSLTGLIKDAEKQAAAKLPAKIRAFCAEEAGDDNWEAIIAEIIIAEGHPSDQIVSHIATTGADVVVMGAHTERTVVDRLIGGTARAVVKSSPVPVLTIQLPNGR